MSKWFLVALFVLVCGCVPYQREDGTTGYRFDYEGVKEAAEQGVAAAWRNHPDNPADVTGWIYAGLAGLATGGAAYAGIRSRAKRVEDTVKEAAAVVKANGKAS